MKQNQKLRSPLRGMYLLKGAAALAVAAVVCVTLWVYNTGSGDARYLEQRANTYASSDNDHQGVMGRRGAIKVGAADALYYYSDGNGNVVATPPSNQSENSKLKPVSSQSRDNLPDPAATMANPHAPTNPLVIGDLFDMFNVPRP
jgi:hypothetical protein